LFLFILERLVVCEAKQNLVSYFRKFTFYLIYKDD